MLTLVQGELWRSGASGWWSVLFTEWAARVAAYILWDAYDNYRLWALSPRLIGFVRNLDLSQVLGSRENENEMLDFLVLIERKDWSTVPREWSHRPSNGPPDQSPGPVGQFGDFFYYDPTLGVEITAEEAAAKHQAPRVIPQGHPTGHPAIAANSLGWAPPGQQHQPMIEASRGPSPSPPPSDDDSDGAPQFPGTPIRPSTPAPADEAPPYRQTARMSVHGAAGSEFRPQLTAPVEVTHAPTGAGSSAAHAAV